MSSHRMRPTRLLSKSHFTRSRSGKAAEKGRATVQLPSNSSVLVFDIIRELLSQKLTEFEPELLLKIVRNSAGKLRLDGPSALKDIICVVQIKLVGQDKKLSSRTRFLIITLTNLKNNKTNRTAGQQH